MVKWRTYLAFALFVIGISSALCYFGLTADVPLVDKNSGSELVRSTAEGETLAALMGIKSSTPGPIPSATTPAPPTSTSTSTPCPTPYQSGYDWVCPPECHFDGSQIDGTAYPACSPGTPYVAPTPTDELNPMHSGGVAFDGNKKVSLFIDPQGLNLAIPYLSMVPIGHTEDFNQFFTYQPVALTWLADGHVPLMLVHSGVYRGSGLPMWEVQQFLETDQFGNRSTEDFIQGRLDQLKGAPVVVISGDCAVEECTATLFQIAGAVRIKPGEVTTSQEFLRTGVEDYTGIFIKHGFFIRTCGRQAAGGVYDANRPPWQQARYMIGFEYVGGPIVWSDQQ